MLGKMLTSLKLLVSVCQDTVPYKAVHKQIRKRNLEDLISSFVIHTNFILGFYIDEQGLAHGSVSERRSEDKGQKGVLVWNGLCTCRKQCEGQEPALKGSETNLQRKI